MRVVFDTNVLLSAFLWQSGLSAIYQAIYKGAVTPCFTAQTFAELKRTLVYSKFENQLSKMGITPGEIIELLFERSYFTPSLFEIDVIQDDKSDNYIIDCALSVKARFIVSSDKHILQAKESITIPIIKPREFITHL